MSLEIERKFLINPHFSIDKILTGEDYHESHIIQAYLMTEDKKNLRVRKEDNVYTMCYKQEIVVFGSGNANNEYEFVIPSEQGNELINSTQVKFEKTRYSFQYSEGVKVDLDVFEEHSLYWVEFEFDTIERLSNFTFPKWVGKNITGSKIFNNVAIAKGLLK